MSQDYQKVKWDVSRKDTTRSYHEMDLGTPKFKWQIQHTAWVIIITSTGKHFYYNERTGESVWQLLDIGEEEVYEEFDRIDRDQLILLTAKARGLRLEDGIVKSAIPSKETAENKKDILVAPMATRPDDDAVKVGSEIAPTNSDLEVEEGPADSPSKTEVTSKSLIMGYESSSEEESDGIERVIVSDNRAVTEGFVSRPAETKYEIVDVLEGQIETSDSEPGNESNYSDDFHEGINLDDFSDIESDKEGHDADLEGEFIEMLDENGVNPYNLWDFEITKIISDPRYLSIDSNQKRKAIFDKWSKGRIDHSKQKPTNKLDSEENERAESFDSHKNVSDNKYNTLIDNPVIKYMKFLEKKFKPNNFYVDFKRANRSDSEFEDLALSDKNREKFFKDYKLYYKKSDADRKQIFEKFILSNNSVQKSKELHKIVIEVDRGMTEDDYDYWYGVFSKIVDEYGLTESFVEHTKAYCIGVKERALALLDYFN